MLLVGLPQGLLLPRFGPSNARTLREEGAPPPLAAQEEAPLIDALVEASNSVRAPFFFPGHKMGADTPRVLRKRLLHGTRPLQYDLPELPEIDGLFAADGPIARAQALAAEAFGAARTWYLVNGSTAGVIAAVLACVQLARQRGVAAPAVLLPRNAHRSAVAALIASGAAPVWLPPAYDAASGLSVGVPAAEVRAALGRAAPGSVAAVLLVSPTYHGVLSDVAGAAAECEACGVPLIVDEAHGAHLGFLGPASTATATAATALASGAHVAVQSTHKTLGSLTQSAMVHASGGALARWPRLAPALATALEQQQSSSPSALLLASLDAARWNVAAPSGAGLPSLRRATALSARLRAALVGPRAPRGVRVWEPRAGTAGVAATDPLRLTLLTGGGGGGALESGFALDDALIERGVYAELPEAGSLTFALSAGTRRRHTRRLLAALRRVSRDGAPPSGEAAKTAAAAAAVAGAEWAAARAEMTPREAYFLPQKAVAFASAAGRVSAELVSAYPPGIPMLVPGERVDAASLRTLDELRAAGCTLSGLADESGETLLVIDA